MQRDWPQSAKQCEAHNKGRRHAKSTILHHLQVCHHAHGDPNSQPSDDTKQLEEANGKHIKLDGVMFVNLNLGDSTTIQLLYVTSHVTCLFLSQDVCQDMNVQCP